MGQLDLKGLAEFGVRQALGKLEASTGLALADDLVPLVGPALEEFGIPIVLEIGLAGTALAKLAIGGMKRQAEVSRLAEARRQEEATKDANSRYF